MIVDVAIHVIRVGKLNQFRRGIERAVAPRLHAKSRRERLFAQLCIRKSQKHELPRVKTHLLGKECRIEFDAERHQLRLYAFKAWRGAKRREHLGENFFWNRGLGVIGGDEQPADQPLVILEHVEAVAGRTSVIECEETIQRAGIDEFANQVNRGAVVPVQFIAPVACFLLKQHVEDFRMDLPEVNNLHVGRSRSRKSL